MKKSTNCEGIMNLEKETIAAYFQDNLSKENEKGFVDILSEIGYYHTKCLTNDRDAFADYLESLRPTIKTLSKKRQAVLLQRVTDLCEKCERVAFLEGVRVGAQLILGLTK